jgi:hypothetical protein
LNRPQNLRYTRDARSCWASITVWLAATGWYEPSACTPASSSREAHPMLLVESRLQLDEHGDLLARIRCLYQPVDVNSM